MAVLTDRAVTGTEWTGHLQFPALKMNLASQPFAHSIVFGFVGASIGALYLIGTQRLRCLAAAHCDYSQGSNEHEKDERLDSVNERTRNCSLSSQATFMTLSKPIRAAFSAMIVSAVVGVVGMFFPHVLFSGQAQLQTLIDEGRTPLPVFGRSDDPTVDLLAFARCTVPHHDDDASINVSLGCSAAIAMFKIFVTGLSLGTGIIGGHFWGPLVAGKHPL